MSTRTPATLTCLLALLAVPPSSDGASAQSADPTAAPILELIESVPRGTTLDRTDVDDARDEWPEMIDAATETIEWGAFYISGHEGSSHDLVLEALERAAARGVRVRVLSERAFFKTYPDVLLRLDDAHGIDVRLIDYRSLVGGVMHAKYVVIDRREAFVGSQNFDWRALEHIVEMGLRIRLPAYARALLDVFELDWSRGYPVRSEPPETTTPDAAPATEESLSALDVLDAQARGVVDRPSPIAFTSRAGETVTLYPAFSPRGDLPDPSQWDLPLIVESIEGATDSLRLTLLSYTPIGRDKTYWPELELALRRAANRGVDVRMLVADWGKRSPTIDHLKSLQCMPGVTVRMTTIPEAAMGFIPFARVAHAKYLTVDGRRFWLGTSNWEKSYFTTSRNVGLVADHPPVTRSLETSFDQLWSSEYAYDVDPATTYEPPRVAR